MANRLNRDQLVLRALNLIDSPALDKKDRPAGTVVATALTLEWLQDGLDYFHHLWPIGGALTSASVSVAAGANTITLPSGFLLDYRNGLLFITAPDKRRCSRRSLDYILNLNPDEANLPKFYAVRSTTLLVWPKSDKARTGTLHYYELPAVLASGDTPKFPSDLVLVEFLRIKGLEYVRQLKPGSAIEYADGVIARLQRAGVGPEQEPDEIEMDRAYAPGSLQSDENSWMGDTHLS